MVHKVAFRYKCTIWLYWYICSLNYHVGDVSLMSHELSCTVWDWQHSLVLKIGSANWSSISISRRPDFQTKIVQKEGRRCYEWPVRYLFSNLSILIFWYRFKGNTSEPRANERENEKRYRIRRDKANKTLAKTVENLPKDVFSEALRLTGITDHDRLGQAQIYEISAKALEWVTSSCLTLKCGCLLSSPMIDFWWTSASCWRKSRSRTSEPTSTLTDKVIELRFCRKEIEGLRTTIDKLKKGEMGTKVWISKEWRMRLHIQFNSEFVLL